MRLTFVTYVVLLVAVIVFYAVIGLTHN